MSDMTPGLFDEELTPVPLEQVIFDYRLLSADKRGFVMQRTDETQILLKRTAENIIQIGKNLNEVKERLPHGMFLPWLKSEFGMSSQTADRFRQVAKRFDGKFPNLGNLSVSALYLLASPATSDEAIDEVLHRSDSGEKITHTLAKQIIEEQEARKQAEEAEAQARAQSLVTQQQLFNAQVESSSQIALLNSQIEALQQQMAELEKPETVYVDKPVVPEAVAIQLKNLQEQVKILNSNLEAEKRAIPPDAQKKLDSLQKSLDKLKAERDQQEVVLKQERERIEKLNADINTAIRKQEFAENQDRIRQGWRLITSQAHTAMMQLLGQWPTPIDVQAFDADDWARVDQLKKALRRVLEECESLHYGSDEMIVDSNPYAISLME